MAAVLLVGTCALAAGLLGARDRVVAGEGRCAAPDARVVVDLAKHTLALCDKDALVERFDVRLGKGGVGKTREGDGKTPVGTYALGSPRPSNRYGTFIPIGYPTDDQKKLGYTGGDVGVHGPPRWFKWLGSLVNTFDLSDGCVGLARDAEVERIAAWARASNARTIELR
jgi:murein L,D-transpeptidase YafK